MTGKRYEWISQMKIILLIVFLVLIGFTQQASAQLKLCNKTYKDASVAIKIRSPGAWATTGAWATKGWYQIAAGACTEVISQPLKDRYYWIYAKRSDGITWGGQKRGIQGCVSEASFTIDDFECRGGDRRWVGVQKIDIGETRPKALSVNLTRPEEPYNKAKTGTIQSRCIARWDDSHQVHSVRTIIEWNYQAVKTKMKKMEHCIRLTVTGPVEIEGVAKSYVDHCVDYGLNHQKTKHVLELMAAIVGDVYGGGGALSAAKVSDYVASAAEETIGCLTDTDRITTFVGKSLTEKFNATVKKESRWIYWDL